MCSGTGGAVITEKELEAIWPVGWYRTPDGHIAADKVPVTVDPGFRDVFLHGKMWRHPQGASARAVLTELRQELLAGMYPILPEKTVHQHLKDLLEPKGWCFSGASWFKDSPLHICHVQYKEHTELLKVLMGNRHTHTNLSPGSTQVQVHDALARVLDLPRYP